MAKIEKDNLVITRDGKEFTVSAMAPVIVSASRSTDIPAFFAKWFIERLKAGYCVWLNPFSQKPFFVSFKKTRAIVFWTKNPKPLMQYLPILDEMGINYYFQFTVNDYDAEGFEPHVLKLEKRIEIFKELSQKIGSDRVIWRFDPLIITPKLNTHALCKKIWQLGNKLQGFTNKLVFSFIDVAAYKKVQNNLVKSGIFTKENVLSAESNLEQKLEIAMYLSKCRDAWHKKGWKIELSTCAEGIDLKDYGITHNSCIDGDLLYRLFADNDSELRDFLEQGFKLKKSSRGGKSSINEGLQLDLFSSIENSVQSYDADCEQDKAIIDNHKLKDKGQRDECGCVLSKDIGMYNTCSHGCIYCYANTSTDAVKRNQEKFRSASSSILPIEVENV